MAFTYNTAEISEPINHLRFLVQDTSDAGHFFEDEELTFALTQETNIYRTAAGLCRAIAAKLAKTPSQENASINFDSAKAAAHYMKLAENYDQKAADFEGSLTSEINSGMSFPTIGNGSDVLPAFTRDLHFS